MMWKQASVVAVAATLANAASVPDPCTLATSSYWVSSAVAHACELSIPYNKARSQTIIDSVIKALPYYSLETWFLGSPNGAIPHNVDVRQLLTNVYSQVNSSGYATDWDFNAAVADAFDRERDGHTAFTPNCVSSFSWNIPLSVATFGASEASSSSAPYAIFNGDFPEQGRAGLEAYYLSQGINLRPYDGMQILTIDNDQAQPYLVNLADASSFYQGLFGAYESLSGRYQRLMTRYSADTTSGGYTQEPGRLGMRAYYPGKDVTTFTLQATNGTKYTVRVPWAAHFTSYSSSKSYTSASFQQSICLATGVTTKRDTTAANITAVGKAKFLSRQAVISPDNPEFGITSDATAAAIAATSSNYVTPNLTSFGPKVATIDIYQLKAHPKVGVLYLQQFEPSNDLTYAQYFDQVSSTLYQGLTALKAAGVTKLIIDQSGNRGGYIYAGAIALWSFWPKDLYPGFPAVLRDHDLSRRESDHAASTNDQDSEYNYRFYRDLNYKPLGNNSQFMDPPVPQTINGVPDAYSQQFFDDFGEAADLTPFTTPPFAAEDIVILGNGICASTCSVFTSYLIKYHSVKSAAFGGSPVAVRWSVDAGVKGSEVTSYSTILQELAQAGLSSDPAAPQPLPIKSSFTLNYRNAIPPDQSFNQPILEYTYLPATTHYQYTAQNYNNPQATWEFVAGQYFP